MANYMLWLDLWILVMVPANALYFYLKKNAEKCFFQELADETLLVANYRCSLISANDESRTNERGMMVEIRDPQKRVVLSRLYRSSGWFSYKSHDPGVHTICLHTKINHPSKEKIRIDFDLQVGSHAINRSESLKRTDLTNIEERYQKLVEAATEINKEIDYLRYREEMFRGTTETISRRVLLWMVGETFLLVIMGVWQMENLRKFFESKKLV